MWAPSLLSVAPTNYISENKRYICEMEVLDKEPYTKERENLPSVNNQQEKEEKGENVPFEG